MVYCFSRRLACLYILLLFCGIALLCRLAVIQLVDSGRLATAALYQRVEEVAVDIPRGNILDHHGTPFTNNAVHYSIIIFPRQLADWRQAAAELAVFTNMQDAVILDQLAGQYRPFKLKTDVDAVTAQAVNGLRLPGVLAVAENMRYGNENLAAHVLGYINSADNLGMSGVEAAYDRELRGLTPAYVAALVDGTQNIIPGLGYKKIAPMQGPLADVMLTLDYRVQKIVESVMDRRVAKGAVVVMRPDTGEILAMASRPNFDANDLSNYLQRSEAPLLNRAIAAFQPGSVFKMVVAAAALETGITTPTETFFDPGYIDVGHLRFRGWDYQAGGHGPITFKDAMAYSSNPVFINIGLRLGAARLIDYASRFGLGRVTALGLPGEAAGNLPAADTLYPGDIANLSIGQGSLEVTPVQMATVLTTIVNDGVMIPPYVVEKVIFPNGAVVPVHKRRENTRVISQHTARQLREMLTAVTTYGTGQAAYVANGGAAGKTGSAETGQRNQNGESLDHAWFAGYAPLNHPRYVVVVFVEGGMSGGEVAAPVFHDIVKEILQQ